MDFPSEKESLYQTMHNASLGYQNKNWGIDTLRQWIGRLRKPASVLEVGCGNGKLCNLLSDMGYDVTGLDITEGGYDRKNYKFVKHDITLGFLPFKDNEFDYCVSFDVIEHLEPKWVEEHIFDMFRVSKEVIASIACFTASPFHLSVYPPEWWVEKLNRICQGLEIKTFHIFTDEHGRQRILFHGKKGI